LNSLMANYEGSSGGGGDDHDGDGNINNICNLT
jgi:hypothetical protein